MSKTPLDPILATVGDHFLNPATGRHHRTHFISYPAEGFQGYISSVSHRLLVKQQSLSQARQMIYPKIMIEYSLILRSYISHR